MTDKPILFSGPMIRALLDGRKTQTRRVIKPQPPLGRIVKGDNPYEWGDEEGECTFKLPYDVGTRLWVRESWRPHEGFSNWDLHIAYAADGTKTHFGDGEFDSDWNWPRSAKNGNVPSIFMPKCFSRLTLAVTNVRVQRLQDISEEDAKAEGASAAFATKEDGTEEYGHRIGFHILWDSLNAKRGFGWNQNPWVAALTFTVHQVNIDEMAPQ